MAASAALPRSDASAPVPGDGVVAPQIRLLGTAHFADPDHCAQWDALAGKALEPNPFFESWFLLPSLRAFDPAGKVQLLCMEAGGELLALLPVTRAARYYGHPLPHLHNWVHANCFLGTPLVARGMETAFWQALLAWCDGHAGTALFLHLSHMPADGPLHDALVQALAGTRRPAATVMREERAVLASTLSPDDYLEQSLTGKKRKELRRQHRRLGEEGVLSVERADNAANDPASVAAWIDEFLDLEQRGWKGQAGSALASDPRTADIFRAALLGAAAHGRLDRLAIRLDGRPLAMLASFITPPAAFSFKTAFDEDYARFSPGVLLQRENLELLTRDDIAYCDSCAAADHPMIDHFWRERRSMARHNIGIGGAFRRRLFAMLAARETGAPARGLS
ncbi:GNAT family N-acetyltransferase [Altererythrobacter xixiisoli]|uniref:GNAT family N-acetyltransferase n=1 Tax=Croceibacterium xixiisoli TaxID=1476466 RepID=A0A6I4TRK0_9SPHN|nr:GNAT family N-acetyltransferase [Croceibacterium xixiisoli]MXO98522.1 GNAT family N-acetyltransferase [Croceibacterium xixiisoli]